MAKIHNAVTISFIILSFLSSIIPSASSQGNNNNDQLFVRTIHAQPMYFRAPPVMTHIRLYWHDILSGPTPSVMAVVLPRSNSSTAFGLINMIDDPLTVGPELSSKTVGKAQGFYASASQKDLGLLMTMNFAFTDGPFKGSTISVLGRNEVFSKVREMPIIGGSGVFRFAKGYVEARTYKFDAKTGDATVEYNCFVMHNY